jgi:hypothetical protein
LHVTFGWPLTKFGVEWKAALIKLADVYFQDLKAHGWLRSPVGFGRVTKNKMDLEGIKSLYDSSDCTVLIAGGDHPSAARADLSFIGMPLDALRYVGALISLGTILPCQVFRRGMGAGREAVIPNVSSVRAFRLLTRIPLFQWRRRQVKFYIG